MSKSAIYTTNVSNPTVAVGGIVPVGSTTRRYGCNIRQDGVAIIGATAAQTVAANGVANLTITAIIRNACGCDGSLLSLALDGVASVVNNLAVTVEKL